MRLEIKIATIHNVYTAYLLINVCNCWNGKMEWNCGMENYGLGFKALLSPSVASMCLDSQKLTIIHSLQSLSADWLSSHDKQGN